MQVGFKGRGAFAKAPAIDIQIFDNALDVVARLGERNALYPIDRIDLRIAWITVLRDPLFHSTAARIVTRKGQNQGAAIVLQKGGDFSSAHLGIVDWIRDETLPVVGHAEPLGSISARAGRDLHESNCLGRRNVPLVEAAFGAHNRVDHAPIDWGTDRIIIRYA